MHRYAFLDSVAREYDRMCYDFDQKWRLRWAAFFALFAILCAVPLVGFLVHAPGLLKLLCAPFAIWFAACSWSVHYCLSRYRRFARRGFRPRPLFSETPDGR